LLPGSLIFKGLTVRRLYKSFGIKGLISIKWPASIQNSEGIVIHYPFKLHVPLVALSLFYFCGLFYGEILPYLGVDIKILSYLGVDSKILPYLGIDSKILSYLGVDSKILPYLGFDNKILSYLGVDSKILPYGVDSKILSSWC
jgi:hypothetical protein